jgi:hypothetical protein
MILKTSAVIFTIILALRKHGTPTEVIGLVQAGVAVGGLAGALVAPRLQGRLPLSSLAVGISFAGALLFGAAALVVPSALVALPVALALVLAPAANAALFAAMLRVTPGVFAATMTAGALLAAVLPGLRQAEAAARAPGSP